MKLTLLFLLLLCLSVSGQEIGDTDYWKQVKTVISKDTVIMCGMYDCDCGQCMTVYTKYGKHWERIPDRWTVEVDTIKYDYLYSRSLTFPKVRGTAGYTLKDDGSGNLYWTAETSHYRTKYDTTYIPKQPLFLDSMQRERLEELLLK